MNIEQMKAALLSAKPAEAEVEIAGKTFLLRGVPESLRVVDWDFWLRPDGEKINKARQKRLRAKTLALAIVDDNGERPFNNDEGVEFLHSIDAAIISKASTLAMAILGLSDEDVESKLKKTSDD